LPELCDGELDENKDWVLVFDQVPELEFTDTWHLSKTLLNAPLIEPMINKSVSVCGIPVNDIAEVDEFKEIVCISFIFYAAIPNS